MDAAMTVSDMRNAVSAEVNRNFFDMLNNSYDPNFSDTFAGVYFGNDDKFHICFTDPASIEKYKPAADSKAVDATVRSAQSKYTKLNFADKAVTTDLVSFDVRTYSETYLKSIQEAIRPVMIKLGTYQTSVQPDTNRVDIYVEDAAIIDGINAFLEKASFDIGAIHYICQKNTIEICSTAVNGTSITDFYNEGSIGFHGFDWYYQKYGLVTCGHAAPVGRTLYDRYGAYIGKPWYWNLEGNLDSAFVRLENPNLTPTYQLSDGNSIRDYALGYDNYVGAATRTYGVATTEANPAGYSTGFIRSTSTDCANYYDGYGYVSLYDMIVTSNNVIKGDSGGPLLTKDSFHLLGITTATIPGASTSYFIKASYICLKYHLQPFTYYGTAPLIGDIDGSNHVDTTDARMALQYATGAITSFTYKQQQAADITMDGFIDTTDARLILQNVW